MWHQNSDTYWFLGRYDNQVKVLGQRIEIEFVEQQCALVKPGWRWVAVPIGTTFEDVTQIRVVSDNPALLEPPMRRVTEAAIRGQLGLAGIPILVSYFADIPLLAGDKVNRRLLRELLLQSTQA